MELKASVSSQMAEILTPEALAFVEKLVRQFEPTRAQLLARRVERQKEIDGGALPDCPAATKHIRDDKSWRVASIPADLQDR
ncbi:MAG: malate synthase A, partial [Verrucomicrobiota bacterium]